MSSARQIEEQAAHWLARRDGDNWSIESQEALDQWLSEGFANKAALWRLEEGWRRADRISALGPSQYVEGFPQRLRGFVQPLALAASLVLFLFVGSTELRNTPGAPSGQAITTAVGARKVVPLTDGSRIELNTATMVKAAVTATSREVWLERGEAYFDVRHSETIPFIVHAGPKTVTVLGTRFSVRRDGDKVTVAVLSGRVQVTGSTPRPTTATLVPAGAFVVSEPDATLVTEDAPALVDAKVAWRTGQVVFRNETLAQAAAEFNRYNERKLVVSGNAANLKIGGNFKASNVDGFARLLRDAYDLDVTTTDAAVHVSD